MATWKRHRKLHGELKSLLKVLGPQHEQARPARIVMLGCGPLLLFFLVLPLLNDNCSTLKGAIIWKGRKKISVENKKKMLIVQVPQTFTLQETLRVHVH